MSEETAPIRMEPVDPETLSEGDYVRVGSMQAEGEVLSVNRGKKTAEIRIGSLRVKAGFGDLYRARKKDEKGRVEVSRSLPSRENARPEINLIGMTTAEIGPELENFLDSALIAGFSEVRIVHGMGTGKLRAAVHELLRRHKRVESFRLGKYGEGESGVTIVTLR